MSGDLKRIDPASIPALYRKHNFEPLRGEFLRQRSDGAKCCINTILAVDAGGKARAMEIAVGLDGTFAEVAHLLPLSGLDYSYAYGLAFGWDDGLDLNRFGSDLDLPSAEIGIQDGRVAWHDCWAAFRADASMEATS